MTFFEKELHRLFDDSECISADAVFAGKTMIAPIGEDLRAKVQFVYTNTHAKYDALRLTIINRHEGTVDSETFKFKDIFPVIDLILAVLFFVKVATAYLDYRKHGQFEWTAPAILLGTLIFALTCPLYIWNILGI